VIGVLLLRSGTCLAPVLLCFCCKLADQQLCDKCQKCNHSCGVLQQVHVSCVKCMCLPPGRHFSDMAPVDAAGAVGAVGVQQLCAGAWASLTQLELAACSLTHQVCTGLACATTKHQNVVLLQVLRYVTNLYKAMHWLHLGTNRPYCF
jgi:hypothetical protein